MYWLFSLTVFVLFGCGKPAQILSPSDGQVFQLENFTGFQVILQNNDYASVSTEFRGAESLTGIVNCQNATGTMAQCYPAYNTNGIGGVGLSYGTCSATQPCVVTIVVRRNNSSQPDSVISVRFQRGSINGSSVPGTTTPR